MLSLSHLTRLFCFIMLWHFLLKTVHHVLGNRNWDKRPLVWSLMLVWPKVRLCVVFTVAVVVRINFPLVSLFFTFLLYSGSPRDLFLNMVWDVLYFQFYSPVIIQEFYWWGGKVQGETKCFIILRLGLSLLVKLYPCTVTFTTTSQLLFFPLRLHLFCIDKWVLYH